MKAGSVPLVGNTGGHSAHKGRWVWGVLLRHCRGVLGQCHLQGCSSLPAKEPMMNVPEMAWKLWWEWTSECPTCIIWVLWAVICHRPWNCCKYNFLFSVLETQSALLCLPADLLGCIYEWQAACVYYLIYKKISKLKNRIWNTEGIFCAFLGSSENANPPIPLFWATNKSNRWVMIDH